MTLMNTVVTGNVFLSMKVVRLTRESLKKLRRFQKWKKVPILFAWLLNSIFHCTINATTESLHPVFFLPSTGIIAFQWVITEWYNSFLHTT